jgi:hypothetical protein
MAKRQRRYEGCNSEEEENEQGDELLEKAEAEIRLRLDKSARAGLKLSGVASYISEVLALPRAPHFETPEQYEKCAGEKWPDSEAMYFRVCEDKASGFAVYTYGEVLRLIGMAVVRTGLMVRYQIVYATKAGRPTNDWEPEIHVT